MLVEDFDQLIRSRYSVRDFSDQPIDKDVLAQILEAARYAPSWSNTRPYMLAVASGEQTQRLRQAYCAAYDRAQPLLRKEPKAVLKALFTRSFPDADYKTWGKYPPELLKRRQKLGRALYELLEVKREDHKKRSYYERRNCEFFGAPTVIFVFVHAELMPFAAHDAGLMLQTLMLAAQARQVGSCALGTLATWRHPVAAEFEIPSEYKLITGLALGYPTDNVVNTFRAEHQQIALARPKIL